MEVVCSQCQNIVEMETVRHKKVCPRCHAIDPMTHLPDGAKIAGFEIRGLLGYGGMGVVYRAMQLNLQRLVAFKVLNDALSADHEFVTRFFREARAAAALSHPNIVQAYDAGIGEDGICYFAMELIEGKTYDALLEERVRFSEADVRQIGLKVAQALEYAWERQQLSHGDIKPENLIQDDLMGVKLSDLGLARSSLEVSTGDEESVMATPLYAPPEIVSGETSEINQQSDMYSLGATLYHMLTGSPLYPDNDPYAAAHRHVTDTYTPLTHYGVSANFSAFVDSLLRKNPAERPVSWSAVVKRLEEIIQTPCGVVHIRTRKLKKMNYLAAGIVGVILVALAGVGVYKFLMKSDSFSPDGSDRFSKEWEAIGMRTAAGADDANLAIVETFLTKVPAGHPVADSARQLQQLFRERIEKRKREIARMAAEREAVLKAVMPPLTAAEALEMKSATNADLNRHIKALRAAENKYGAADKSDLPPDLEDRLGAQLQRITSEVATRSRSEIEGRNAAFLKERRESEALWVNRLNAPSPLIDLENRLSPLGYYEFVRQLSVMMEENNLAGAVETAERWRPTKPLSIKTQNAVEMIRRIFKATQSPNDIISDRFVFLEGKTVPVSFPALVQGYRFESVRADGKIRLDIIDKQTRARLFKFVTYDELSPEAFTDMLDLLLANGNLEKLSEDQQDAVFRYVCFAGNEDIAALVRNHYAARTDDTSRLRIKLLNDFACSAEHLAGIMVLKQSCDALAGKDDIDAIHYFNMFSAAGWSADSINVYVGDLEKGMRQYCGMFQPETEYEAFAAAAVRDDRFPLAAYGRYAGLDALSRESQQKLQRDYDARMKALRSSTNFPANDPLPFLHANKSKAGEHLAAFEKFGDNHDFKHSKRNTLAEAVMYMNAGDWKPLRTLMNKRNYKHYIEACNHPSWDVFLLYDFALGVRHYGAAPHFKDAFALLSDICKDKTHIDANTYLAELALQSGDFAATVPLKTVVMSKRFASSSSRLAVMRLFCASLADGGKGLGTTLTDVIRDLRKVGITDEISHCQALRSLVTRRELILTDDETRSFLASPLTCDLWARLLLAHVSDALAQGKTIYIEWEKFYEAIEAVMPDNVSGSPLWHEYWTFRMARAIKEKTTHSDLAALLKTPGLQTLADALDLEMLQLAFAVRGGRLSPTGAERCMLRYIENAPTAPNYYKSEMKNVFSDESDFDKTAAFAAWAPREAFGIYLAAAVAGRHAEKPVEALGRLAPKLSPSERLLIQTLRQNWN